MFLLNSFFGLVAILAVMACGLSFLLAPDFGREIIRRLVVSIVLFAITGVLVTWPAGASFLGALRLLLAFVCFGASVLYLLSPGTVEVAFFEVGKLAMCSILLFVAVLYLWNSNRLMLVIGAAGLGAVALFARSSDRH